MTTTSSPCRGGYIRLNVTRERHLSAVVDLCIAAQHQSGRETYPLPLVAKAAN